MDSIDIFNDKKILITGGHGFIGKSLVKRLKALGPCLSVIDIIASKNLTNTREYIGDLTDKIFTQQVIDEVKPDIIFHLAADKNRSRDIDDFYKSIDTNLIASLNLFSAIKDLDNLDSIVVLGTSEEYGSNCVPFKEGCKERPVSNYSFSKLCVTNLSELMYPLYKIPVVVLRPSIAYGPGQSIDMFLPALISALSSSKPFSMTEGKQRRDFIYVDDLIDALLLSSTNKNALGQIINLGCGSPVLIRDLAMKVGDMLGRRDLIKFGDLKYRENEIMDYYLDISKAKSILGWSPKVDIDRGLELTIKAYGRG